MLKSATLGKVLREEVDEVGNASQRQSREFAQNPSVCFSLKNKLVHLRMKMNEGTLGNDQNVQVTPSSSHFPSKGAWEERATRKRESVCSDVTHTECGSRPSPLAR